MDSREDINKYHNGASIMINATVLPHGGFTKRSGTEYIATAANRANLIPFEFSVDDVLVLEFSNLLLRFYKDQAIVNDNVGTDDLSGVDSGALLAHWKLNETEGTNVVNADNPGTYDMTATVDASTIGVDGKVDGAFDLDGQYTTELADTDATFNFTDGSNDTAFSLVCWAEVTTKGGLQVLLSKWRDKGSTREWRFSLSKEQKLQLHLADEGTGLAGNVVCQWKLNDDAADTNVIASLPQYTIATATSNGADTITITSAVDLTASFPDASEFTIEGSSNNDGQYVVASTDYTATTFTITTTGLTDSTNDGTVAPHAGVSDDSNTEDINATGQINGALNFGGDQAMVIDDSADFSFIEGANGDFSIAAWVYFTSTGTDQTIFNKWEGGSAREWQFFVVGATDKLQLSLYDETNDKHIYRTSNTALSEGWHFVCATYEGENGSWTGATAMNFAALYVDGSVVASAVTNDAGYVKMVNQTTKVVIGARSPGTLTHWWKDKIDNVILFDKELAASEISNLYNSGVGTEGLGGVVINSISDDALTTGWHLLACTYSAPSDETAAAGGIILYVDGAAVDSTATNDATYTAMQSGAEEIRIGSQRDSGDSANENFFEDKIDEVSVFNDVLTPTEVASLYSTTPYSIVSPYTSTQAFQVHVTQSADVMYMAHTSHHPKKLSRLDTLNWTLIDVPFTGGPFLVENTTAASLVGFARVGGTARSGYYFPAGATGTLTASGTDNKPFNSNMVGALWLVKHTRDNDNDTDTFAQNTNIVPTSEAFADGAIFIKGDATVTFEPIATSKMAQLWRKEGNGNWQTYRSFRAAAAFSWTEDEDDVLYAMTRSDNSINGTLTAKNQVNRGIVKITGFTSSTVVTVEVIDKVLSNNSNDNAVTTSMWAEGAWSDYRGYPRTVTFFEDRVWWASTTNNPDTLWSSQSGNTGGYENMEVSELGLDTDAITAPINDNEVSQIQWMQARQVMAIGAANKEYRFGASNIDDPVTPSDRKATPQTGFSSGNIQPVILNDTIFFFQRNGKKLGAMKFDAITENFNVDDATLLVYKLFDSAPTNMAVQRVPDSLIWTVRTDGVLPTFTYEPKEEVSGWARQIFGNFADVDIATGYIESVAVVHGSAEDEVWACIRRVINTATVYYIEKFKPRDWGSDIEDACYVDSAITYDSTKVSTVTAAHLKGETLAVFADGEVFDNAVADSSTGVITLKKSGNAVKASVVQYGLPYTMKVRTMRLSVPQEGNTIQTRIKRIHSVVVRFIRSLLGSAGQEYAGVEYLQDLQATYSTASQDTGEDERLAQGGFSEDAYTTIVSDDPVPFTGLSTIISFEIEERR